MNTEEIEQLVQKVVDEVMKKIGNKTLVATALGDQDKIPKSFRAPLRETLMFSDKIEDADLILANELSFTQLIALSHLQAVDEITQVIVAGLFKKKTTFVLSTDLSLKALRQQTRYGVWQQFNEVIQKLESFGIYFIQSQEMLKTLLYQENMRKKRNQL